MVLSYLLCREKTMNLEKLIAVINTNYDLMKFSALDDLVKQAAADIQAAGAFLAATYEKLDKGSLQTSLARAETLLRQPGSISPDIMFDYVFLDAFNQRYGELQQLVTIIAQQSASAPAMNNLIQAVPFMLVGWAQAVVSEFLMFQQATVSVASYLQGVNETNIKLSQVYIGMAGIIANTAIPQEQVPAPV